MTLEDDRNSWTGLKASFAARSTQVDWRSVAPDHEAALARMVGSALTSGYSPSDQMLAYAGEVATLAGTEIDEVKRALIADCALRTMDANSAPGPLDIEAFRRLATYLDRAAASYEGEPWQKDVNLALGLSEPCGVVSADRFGRLRWRVIAGSIRRFGRPELALDYVRWQGWGHWYEPHMDVRYLSAFSAAGWTTAYLAIADLLERNPHIRGAFASSWFFDPHLGGISPELAYLAELPKSGGATLIRNRPLPIDVTWATARSAARQRAMKEGRYDPTAYTMVWPRKALIDWAEGQRQDAALRATTAPTGKIS